MKFIEKLSRKNADIFGAEPVVMAFLGDSVTHGCFEVYALPNQTSIDTHTDYKAAYHAQLRDMLATLYPKAPLQVINAGLSGGNAPNGLARLERDVLRFSPDLTVVCFGLNDCGRREEGLNDYTESLRRIFRQLKAAGSEVIFLTPNMMNTYVAAHITNEAIRNVAGNIAALQNEGILDLYIDAARAVAKEEGVLICDAYAAWKKLAESGVDTTMLLSNDINHPTRAMHGLFAQMLCRMLFEN